MQARLKNVQMKKIETTESLRKMGASNNKNTFTFLPKTKLKKLLRGACWKKKVPQKHQLPRLTAKEAIEWSEKRGNFWESFLDTVSGNLNAKYPNKTSPDNPL